MAGSLVAKKDYDDLHYQRIKRMRRENPRLDREISEFLESVKQPPHDAAREVNDHIANEFARMRRQRMRAAEPTPIHRTPMSRAAMGIAAGTLGFAGVAHVAARRKQKQARKRSVGKRYDGPDIANHAPQLVQKRLVDEQKKTSMIRAVGMGSGLAALGWGGSRLKYLGPGLRAGKEMFEPINPRVSNVLRHAEGLRRTTERGTDPIGRITGRGIGHMPVSLRRELDKVPRDLRPATATLAGAILVHQSTPVRRTSYRPVGDA